MKIRRVTAFSLGVIAALVISLIMIVMREAEFGRLDLEMLHGSLVTGSFGPLTWAIGCGMQLLAGGLAALLYGMVFELAGVAGWRRGLLLGVPHSVLSGLWLALLPALHPAVPEHPWLPAPGFMAQHYGAFSAIALVALHLLFGLIVGGGYPVNRPARGAPMSHGPA
jgi:hypothetical protein